MGVNGGWPAPRPLFPHNGLTMQTRAEEQPKVRMKERGDYCIGEWIAD